MRRLREGLGNRAQFCVFLCDGPARRRVKQVDAAVIRSAPPTPSMRSPTISAISCERWRCLRTIEPWSPTSLREKLIGAKVVSRGHYERAYACRLPRPASRNLGGNLSSCARLEACRPRADPTTGELPGIDRSGRKARRGERRRDRAKCLPVSRAERLRNHRAIRWHRRGPPLGVQGRLFDPGISPPARCHLEEACTLPQRPP